LEQFFFENTYNDKNERNSISFDKKIIVFEDIDCIGDIILDRNSKKSNSDAISNSIKEKSISSNADSVKIGDVIQTICGLSDNGAVKISGVPEEELITLDDILNLWDGIRETPGRILIISSNHYNKLDPALIRPGRIDITHEFSNASHNTITEMYSHLFDNKIDTEMLKNVTEYFYSPAELINIFVTYKKEEQFMKRLLENKKI
jgi:chaperone BCS1